MTFHFGVTNTEGILTNKQSEAIRGMVADFGMYCFAHKKKHTQ